MFYKDYRYNWAMTIKPAQRKIDLLYKICESIPVHEKMVLYQIIRYKKQHLKEIKTLSTYEAFKEKDEESRLAMYNVNRKRDRLIRQQAESELYRQAVDILKYEKQALSSTDKRICKVMICNCRAMQITIDLMIEIDSEESVDND